MSRAHAGMIRAPASSGIQTEQVWCLTSTANAVIAWTAEYYGLAVEQMRRAGRRIDDEVLAHVSPAHRENIPSDEADGALDRVGLFLAQRIRAGQR
ncbi:Tn3 family transposase [Streptomyces lydicus]